MDESIRDKASGPAGSAGPTLFVATNLATWVIENSNTEPADITVDGVCYRRLDSEYFAWLRHNMLVAKRRAKTGALSADSYQLMRKKFSVIFDWAHEHLGQKSLQLAAKVLDPRSYPAPGTKSVETYRFPKEGTWPFCQSVTAKDLAKVDAIRDRALKLGWSTADLYQNQGRLLFPFGGNYGLVCFVHGQRRLGKVSEKAIEIIGPPPGETRLSFYRRQLFETD